MKNLKNTEQRKYISFNGTKIYCVSLSPKDDCITDIESYEFEDKRLANEFFESLIITDKNHNWFFELVLINTDNQIVHTECINVKTFNLCM
jgi:hypothetical protein